MTAAAKPVAPASAAPLAADLDAALRRLKLATVRRGAAEVLQVGPGHFVTATHRGPGRLD